MSTPIYSVQIKLYCSGTFLILSANLRVAQSIVQAVSREDGGFIVDVVQRYLHSWQSSYTSVITAKRKHECEVERLATIGVVGVNLEIRRFFLQCYYCHNHGEDDTAVSEGHFSPTQLRISTHAQCCYKLFSCCCSTTAMYVLS